MSGEKNNKANSDRRVASQCFDDRTAGDADGLGDRGARDAPVAFPNDVIPGHSRRNQLQNIAHQDSSAPERELAVADLGISGNESSDWLRLHSEIVLQRIHSPCIGRADIGKVHPTVP